ncbi:MAG: MmcQ/YjbR family DNA-binding protein [Bacteroidota bacterium]
MNVEEVRTYCLSKKGVTEGFPFGEETLVFKVMGKMFALLALERTPSQINLKCDPEQAILLREAYPEIIIPGYHMNKKHWNTLMLGQLPTHLIQTCVDDSYELVVTKLPKKDREMLSSL